MLTRTFRRRGSTFARASVAIAAATLGLAALATPVDAKKNKGPDEPSRGSLYSVVDQIGARELWAEGFTGEGVTVAVVDTGIAPVEALLEPGKVTALVDLSFESTVPEAVYLDTYGHGTHMAGIIAGKSPGADPAEAEDHPEWFLGVAPDAQLVSVKVGDSSGAVDVSQVIAGVDWVTDHAEDLGIDVLNLSYASGSTLPYESDPLTYAIERAWNAGIVVVVASGNDGRGAGELATPATDPHVIAVSPAEAKKKKGKFKVPSWATSGDGDRNPDLVAPGKSIESLRVPGSRADLEHPEGYVDEQLFLGSGSSQAAAVVSGAVALILDARPDLSPDEVKALLMSDTARVTPSAARHSGAGMIKLDEMHELDVPADYAQDFPASDGSGSLEAARGDQHVVIDGVELTGETTALGNAWAGNAWAGTRWQGNAWAGEEWTGVAWAGNAWAGTSWAGNAWAGTSWAGSTWSGSTWSGSTWSGNAWAGTSWAGNAWAGNAWAGTSWAGNAWAGNAWAGDAWAGNAWAGNGWA